LAAGENHVATIKLLLYHKAAPGAQDKYGYAPDDLQLCALRMEIRPTVEAHIATLWRSCMQLQLAWFGA
jgi:hypothetical protein